MDPSPATLALLGSLPDAVTAEIVEPLVTASGVRVERIVSHGQSTPAGTWFDQPEAEWVVLLAGSARLQIEGEAEPRSLSPGDAVYLPAHCRHRVAWTSPDQPTVWLALFLDTALSPVLAAQFRNDRVGGTPA